MKQNKSLEYILVAVQVVTSAYLVLDTAWMSLPIWAVLVTISSGILAIWAIFTMKISNLNIVPSPKETARLASTGPYRLIRHPMYTSLVILVLPLIISSFSLIRVLAGIALVVDLILKLRYEERLLIQRFPEYQAYQERTYRIIPGIY